MVDRIYEHSLIAQALAPASSSTVRNGGAIDMMGWDGCDFILNVGDIASTGTLNAKVQKDTTSAFSTPTDITSAAITALADTDDSKAFVISVCEPSERYLRIVVTAATAASISGAIAIRWRSHGGAGLPPTQVAAEIITVGPGC
jgi:hypothetical protein